MIDDAPGSGWAEAIAPDHRSLKLLKDEELKAPFIIDRVAQWHGISMGEARDRIGAELLDRTRTTERPE